MKQIAINLILLVLVSFLSCTKRDISELQELKYPVKSEVFLDEFAGDLQYAAFGGSDVRAFNIDRTMGYGNSFSSLRVNVPNANSPQGAFAGGVFFSSVGRDLSQFTALTFYIKASQSATIGQIGFGNDLGENKFVVSQSNLAVSTGWTKVVIPIPDPSKLVGERGLLWYAAGAIEGRGFTFWIDEVKFENLGTIGNRGGTIMNGNDASLRTFIGVNTNITGLNSVFNLPTGVDQAFNLSSAYFQFSSSNPSVATVDANGVVRSLAAGTAVITATLGGVPARGSLTINCAGAFVHAPTPTLPQSNVISIFSDAFTNVPVNYFNGYWEPWQTTISNDFTVNGDNVLNYNIFNFVGIEFSSPTVNATSMTHFHMNVFFPDAISAGRQLRVIVVDFGPDGVFGGGDDTRHSTTFTAPFLVTQRWLTINIPFSAMPSLIRRNNLAQIILEGGDGTSLYVDNIYFWR
jgi:hypothetical protein